MVDKPMPDSIREAFRSQRGPTGEPQPTDAQLGYVRPSAEELGYFADKKPGRDVDYARRFEDTWARNHPPGGYQQRGTRDGFQRPIPDDSADRTTAWPENVDPQAKPAERPPWER
jgi:hypothetical protein